MCKLTGLFPIRKIEVKGSDSSVRNGRKRFGCEIRTRKTRADKHSKQNGENMEKHSGVFERFVQFENLYDGYLLARRDKRFKPEVLAYSAHLEENLIDAQNHLIWQDLVVKGIHSFYEYFPKIRLIHALPFRYRVMNCAAYNVLWPIYSRSFYEHSYGSIPGRGQVRACDQLQQWLRWSRNKPEKWYIGKMDIQKFFFRIPIEVQIRELMKPLDDVKMLWYLETMIRSDGRPFGMPLEYSDPFDVDMVPGIGMQVGSLISQMTANVVLTPVDHYIKRVLKAPKYIRYMDDMRILTSSKQQAWDIIGRANEYLQNDFGLQLNHKTAVIPAEHGCEYIGKIVTADKIHIRKDCSLRMKKHLDYVRRAYAEGEVPLEYAISVIQSYLGLLSHTSDDALRERICQDFVLVRKSAPD